MPREPLLTVFVYFRSSPEERARTAHALERQFALVAEACGIQGRGGLRCDRDKPYLTWLEVYERVEPAGLQSVLESLETCARRSGLAELAQGGRHREVFEALADAH